ncbi:hypothetical protein Dsin_008389 [Dipteronia sinensis]|uniref:Uncharacterized protein n=1 Tax=Dipteronia sinensis TaxID=43782 RepID=A0AAE0EAW4_9ROSI|nr:hypothetical protein Dsin_008389 [Dipteronia sinensis]
MVTIISSFSFFNAGKLLQICSYRIYDCRVMGWPIKQASTEITINSGEDVDSISFTKFGGKGGKSKKGFQVSKMRGINDQEHLKYNSKFSRAY